jgi:hypothetical protein
MYQNAFELKGFWQKLNFIYLLGALIIASIAMVLSAYKFKLIIDLTFKKSIVFGGWLQVFVRGFLMNSLIPYSGVAYRGYHLKKYYAISYTDYISSSYLFALIGLVLLLCMSGLLLSYHHDTIIFLSLVVFLLLAVKLKLLLFGAIGKLSFQNKKVSFYVAKLKTFDDQLQKILRSDRKVLFFSIFFVSLCFDFFIYASVFCSIYSDIPLNILVYVYLPYSLGWLIRLTPGNLGIQELLMGGVTTVVGLGVSTGITLSILLRCITLAGAFFVWFLSSALRLK